MNWELPQVQAGFRKDRGTRGQIGNICWIIDKAREFQKNIYFCFIDYAKTFDCVDFNKLWHILKEMGTPGHLTCLLRNWYAGQEATVRTRHGTMDWFKIWKEVQQGCHLAYFTYMQRILWQMPGWMNNHLETRLPGEMWTASDMHMIKFRWQKVKRNQGASWCSWKRRVQKLA